MKKFNRADWALWQADRVEELAELGVSREVAQIVARFELQCRQRVARHLGMKAAMSCDIGIRETADDSLSAYALGRGATSYRPSPRPWLSRPI